MSTPDATGTRQRKTGADGDAVKPSNPASLSTNPDKKVPRNKPHIKPPLANTPMNKFLTYLVLGLLAVAGFYVWRFTVWAADAGGYWNLVTGRRPATGVGGTAAHLAGKAASKAAAAAHGGGAASAASAVSSAAGKNKGKASGATDIQGQIFQLAQSLGVTPADLNAAIRPLIDPTVPNPAEAARQEAELLKQQLAAANGGAAAAAAKEEPKHEGSLLGVMGEAFLD